MKRLRGNATVFATKDRKHALIIIVCIELYLFLSKLKPKRLTTLPQIRLKKGFHRGQIVIRIVFPYNLPIIDELRKHTPAKWSRTMGCWLCRIVKTRNIAKFIVLIVLLILVNSNLNATNIPDSVIDFINTELPDYSIITTNDYVQGFNEFLRNKNELPFYFSSDFNGDNMPDHAILLIDSMKRLFLFGLIQENNNFKKILIDKFDSQVDGIQIIICVEKKGDWESIAEKITVPNDGICIDLIEESLSWSYYFDGKTFIRFLYD